MGTWYWIAGPVLLLFKSSSRQELVLDRRRRVVRLVASDNCLSLHLYLRRSLLLFGSTWLVNLSPPNKGKPSRLVCPIAFQCVLRAGSFRFARRTRTLWTERLRLVLDDDAAQSHFNSLALLVWCRWYLLSKFRILTIAFLMKMLIYSFLSHSNGSATVSIKRNSVCTMPDKL